MKISKIYSTRKNNNAVYSDLIYEWEDVFADKLEIPIYSYSSKIEKIIRRLLYRPLALLQLSSYYQKLSNNFNSDKYTLVFELYPRTFYSFQVSGNKIPYIIDFDYNVNLDTFYSVYKNCKLIIISSLQAYNYLISNNCPLNIKHLALSLSDIHRPENETIPLKEFDVIVTRSNNFFLEGLKRFAEKNPDFEYVIRKWEGSQLYKKNVYISNKRGILGEFSDRKSYFDLLSKAKVALYSTPGIDSEEKRFINHVTPTLFEFLSAGCRIIARYPENEETHFFNLENISDNVKDFSEFELILERHLSDQTFDYLYRNRGYLNSIYTSNRVNEFKELISK